MPAFALIDALADFGAPRPTARVVAPVAVEPVEPPPPPEPEPERFTRDELDRAVAEAQLEVEQRLRAQNEAETAELAAAHAGEIESLRRELGEQAGLMIAARLSELETTLVTTTNAVVARILGVALTEEVTRGAVDALARSVAAALADRDAVRLRIRGPLSLFEALRPALGDHADRAEFTEAPGADLTVSLDAALFETRIADWSAALAEALAGARL